jgi:hypothetical protein
LFFDSNAQICYAGMQCAMNSRTAGAWISDDSARVQTPSFDLFVTQFNEPEAACVTLVCNSRGFLLAVSLINQLQLQLQSPRANEASGHSTIAKHGVVGARIQQTGTFGYQCPHFHRTNSDTAPRPDTPPASAASSIAKTPPFLPHRH